MTHGLLVVVVTTIGLNVGPQEPSVGPARFESEIQKLEELGRQTPPAPGGVVFVGSSSIKRWSSLAEDFPEIRVLNRGFGGSKIADSTHFAGRIITPAKPRMVVLYAGDNDLAGRRTPEQVLADFNDFVRRVRQDLPDVRIAFIAIKPSPARAKLLPEVRRANAMIRALIESDKNLDFIDVFHPMLDNDGNPRPELFVDDRLHLNQQGYALWASIVRPYLK